MSGWCVVVGHDYQTVSVSGPHTRLLSGKTYMKVKLKCSRCRATTTRTEEN